MNNIYLQTLHFSLLLLCCMTTTVVSASEMVLTDTIRPVPSIDYVANDVEEPFFLTVIYSEVITPLEEDAVYLENGEVVNLNILSDSSYYIKVNPITGGEVRFALPEGAVEDLTGNPSIGSDTIVFNYLDNDNPVPVLTNLTEPGIDEYDVELRFSEPVYGLEMSDFQLAVSNGAVTSIDGEDGSDVYMLHVVPGTPTYPASISLEANAVVDGSGNPNNESNTLLLTITPVDQTPPTVTLTTTTNYVYEAFTVEANFSEAIQGLELEDIIVTNGSAMNLEQYSAQGIFRVAPNQGGVVTVELPQGMVTDNNNNLNENSNILVVNYIEPDTTRPVISLTVLNDGIADQRDLKLSFSEPVSDIETDSIILTNCEMLTFQRQGNDYYFTLKAIEEGVASLDILEDAVRDTVGNGSFEFGTFLWDYEFIPLEGPDTVFNILGLASENEGILVNWETNTEADNQAFVIMHTADLATDFVAVDTVSSVNDVNFELAEYQYLYKTPRFGTNYFFIRQIYQDGSYTDSQVASIDFSILIEEALVFPNPVYGNYITLNTGRFAGIRCEVLIFNELGRIYHYETYDALPTTPIKINVSGYEAGIYGIQFWIKANAKIEDKFMILH